MSSLRMSSSVAMPSDRSRPSVLSMYAPAMGLPGSSRDGPGRAGRGDSPPGPGRRYFPSPRPPPGRPSDGSPSRPPGGVGIDVVQERGEPWLPALSCYLAHTARPLGTPGPAHLARHCVRGVVCWSCPLWPAPSLHHLRGRCCDVARRPCRYYGAVRPHAVVHHRTTALALPVRPAQ